MNSSSQKQNRPWAAEKTEITVQYLTIFLIGITGWALLYAKLNALAQPMSISFINCFGQTTFAWLVGLQLNQCGKEPKGLLPRLFLYLGLCHFAAWCESLTIGLLV